MCMWTHWIFSASILCCSLIGDMEYTSPRSLEPTWMSFWHQANTFLFSQAFDLNRNCSCLLLVLSCCLFIAVFFFYCYFKILLCRLLWECGCINTGQDINTANTHHRIIVHRIKGWSSSTRVFARDVPEPLPWISSPESPSLDSRCKWVIMGLLWLLQRCF